MKIESLPGFSDLAKKLWLAIAPDTRKSWLSNVWCVACGRAGTITNFTGMVKSGDLLLMGKCAECHGDVAPKIESQ